MDPTNSNILPTYHVEEGEIEVINSDSIPEEASADATILKFRERGLRVVDSSSETTEKIFTGDAALERERFYREIFLKRAKAIYLRMKQVKNTDPLPAFISDNWTLENLGDIVPKYVIFEKGETPIFNETNFLKTQTDSLIESRWSGLMSRIEKYWLEIHDFGNHIVSNLLLSDRIGREGFPPGVFQDINFLKDAHKKAFPERYNSSFEDEQRGLGSRADIKQWKIEDGTKLTLL